MYIYVYRKGGIEIGILISYFKMFLLNICGIRGSYGFRGYFLGKGRFTLDFFLEMFNGKVSNLLFDRIGEGYVGKSDIWFEFGERI